jgi:hypothetical protein
MLSFDFDISEIRARTLLRGQRTSLALVPLCGTSLRMAGYVQTLCVSPVHRKNRLKEFVLNTSKTEFGRRTMNDSRTTSAVSSSRNRTYAVLASAFMLGVAAMVPAGPVFAQSSPAPNVAPRNPSDVAPAEKPAPRQDNPACAAPNQALGGEVTGSGAPSENLSDKLAQNNGVICPPAGVDSDIHTPAPDTGNMPVIRPPGSPGGDPTVQPK